MPQLPGASKWVLRFLFVFSVFGFIDVAYLTAEHYLGRIPPCSLVGGCELVLTSTYATILGVPAALLGALYYFGIFALLFFFRETGDRKFLKILFASSIAGLLFSGWFVYVQLFVLHAICLYCMGSATTSTLIFLGSLWLFVFLRPLLRVEGN